MKEKTFKNSFLLLKEGAKMLLVCCFLWSKKSSRRAIIDLVMGIYRHPIVAIVICSIMAYQLWLIVQMRVDRDAYSIREYKLTTALDSLQIVTDITHFRYENKTDSTSSHKTD